MHLSQGRRAFGCCVALAALALGGLACPAPSAAQGPSLDADPEEIRPGEVLAVEVRGEPGKPALVLLSRDEGGASLGGRALAVGPDFVPIPVGPLDAGGRLRLLWLRIPSQHATSSSPPAPWALSRPSLPPPVSGTPLSTRVPTPSSVSGETDR